MNISQICDCDFDYACEVRGNDDVLNKQVLSRQEQKKVNTSIRSSSNGPYTFKYIIGIAEVDCHTTFKWTSRALASLN